MCYNGWMCRPWRDGRVVEGAALEMLFGGNLNEGSNPSLSAVFGH